MSPMAEAIFRHLAPEILVQSAGSYSSHVRHLVKSVLLEMGIDSHGLRSKDVFGVEMGKVKFAIHLSPPHESPKLPGHIEEQNWALPDPLCVPDNEQMDAFRALRDELMRRIPQLIAKVPDRN